MAGQRCEAAARSRVTLLGWLVLAPQLAHAQASPSPWWADSWSDLQRWLTTPFLTIGTTGVTAAGLFKAAVVVAIALLISRVLRRGLARVSVRLPNLDQGAAYTLGRILHYAILVLALFGGLALLGVDLTKVAIVAGALGVGVGFGLQNIVNNFVSGLILLFERTIKVGDYIELASGITGEVRDINIRSTIVTTNDNVDIVVPNSELVSTSVTNWTLREAVRRIRVPFGVAYGSDKERVRAAALEAAAAVEHTLHTAERAPQVWLVGFGDSSLNFELIVWLTAAAVKRPARIAADYNWELETALRKHGIEIPFPQRDIHVRSAPALRNSRVRIESPDENRS
jgi:potassium-dependent mechanosensitive channel